VAIFFLDCWGGSLIVVYLFTQLQTNITLPYFFARYIKFTPSELLALHPSQRKSKSNQKILWEINSILQRLGLLSNKPKKYMLYPCSLLNFEEEPFEFYWKHVSKSVLPLLQKTNILDKNIVEIFNTFLLNSELDSSFINPTKAVDKTELFLIQIALLSLDEIHISKGLLEAYIVHTIRYFKLRTYKNLTEFNELNTLELIQVLQYALPNPALRDEFKKGVMFLLPSNSSNCLTYDELEFIINALKEQWRSI
jgi:hypothetical protein